jgi:hypothetical protein
MCLYFDAVIIAATTALGPYTVLSNVERTEATVKYSMPAAEGGGATLEATSELTSARRNSLADAASIVYTAVWTPQVQTTDMYKLFMLLKCYYKNSIPVQCVCVLDAATSTLDARFALYSACLCTRHCLLCLVTACRYCGLLIVILLSVVLHTLLCHVQHYGDLSIAYDFASCIQLAYAAPIAILMIKAFSGTTLHLTELLQDTVVIVQRTTDTCYTLSVLIATHTCSVLLQSR